MILVLGGSSIVLFVGCCTSNPSREATDTQAADFVVTVNREAFVVRLVKPEQIAIARARADGSKPQGIVSGKLADGDGGFNRNPSSNKRWTWHLIPESVSFPELAMELCDGRPSDVEANKSHWLNDIKMFCPWSAKIIGPVSHGGFSLFDYEIPDQLPARAKLTLVRTERKASLYKATWDETFQFDPNQAGLALDMNTIGWLSMARISIANKDNNSNLVGHQHLRGPNPTTSTFEDPPEHIEISPLEAGWVKEGGIIILIHNDQVGEPETLPTIVTVDLVKR